MPLKSLVNESGVRPSSSNLNSVYVSLLRLIAVQEKNNDYLEGLTLATGLSTADAGFALVVDPTGSTTALEAVDQRTYIRLQDVLGLSSPKTSGTDTTVTATLGSTGAGGLTLAGKTGSASAATAVITQLGSSSAATGTITVLEDTEGDNLLDDTITVGDGDTSVVFTFKSAYGSSGTPRNTDADYYILIESGDDTDQDIAEAIQYSLNYAETQGNLEIASTWSGGSSNVVSLTNNYEGSNRNIAITTTSAASDITVAGMSGGVSVGTALDGTRITLVDAGSTSHTLEYSTSSSTSSTMIGVAAPVVDAARAAAQVKIAINLAEAAGDIDITAVDNGDATVTLTMGATGTSGNGDKISGTAESGGHITATSFTGGTAGDQFSLVVDGDTGTSAGISVQKADTISLSGASVSLTATGTISLSNATIGDLIYPSSDGSADNAITTDGSGNLSFQELRQFNKKSRFTTATSYTHTYETLADFSQMAVEPEASSSTAKNPGYSFSGHLTTGIGAHVDSSVKAHNLFIKFGDDYVLRTTDTTSGDIVQLGNTEAEFDAGTYTLVKPSLRGANSWPTAGADFAGALFYDPTNAKMHFYTSAVVKEIATVDNLSGKVDSSGDTFTGALTLSNSARSVSSLDLMFADAANSGFYATDSSDGSGKSVTFVYSGSEVLELAAEGIQGVDLSDAQTPFLNYQTSTGQGDTAAFPSYTFTGDTNTGLYRSASDTLSFTTGGTRRGSVSSAGWDFNNLSLYNVATPTAGQNSYAVPKSYVDGIITPGSTADEVVSYDSSTSTYTTTPGFTAPSAAGYQWAELGLGSTTTGILTLKHSSHSYNTTLQPSSTLSGLLALTLPSSDGAADSVLTTDGSGQLEFKTLSTIGNATYATLDSAVFTDTIQVADGDQYSPSITYGSGSVGSYRSTGQATATFSFGDTEFDTVNDATITLIDTAGTSKTYKIKNDGTATASSQEFNAGATASAAATNFVTLLLSSDGHNGTITAEANTAAGKVEMVQAVGGTSGNSTIAHTTGWDTICDINPPSDFSGGTASEAIIYQLSSFNRIAQFTDVACGTASHSSIQGFSDKSGRMVTEIRSDAGPMFTFVGEETTGVGYSKSGGVSALQLHADDAGTPIMSLRSTGITLNSVGITGLSTPVGTTDAANKSYVDAAVLTTQAPASAGTADGQIPTYDTSTSLPIYNTGLVYNSDDLSVGTSTGGTGTEASLKLTTSYSYISIAAPAATASSGTGSIAAYTMTLPDSVGTAGTSLCTTDGAGTLAFHRRGNFKTTVTVWVDTLSMDSEWHDYRHDMELTAGAALGTGSLDVTTGKTAPSGFIVSTSGTLMEDVYFGSSASSFQRHSSFQVYLNGVRLDKISTLTWVDSNTVRIGVRIKEGDRLAVEGMSSTDITDMGY